MTDGSHTVGVARGGSQAADSGGHWNGSHSTSTAGLQSDTSGSGGGGHDGGGGHVAGVLSLRLQTSHSTTGHGSDGSEAVFSTLQTSHAVVLASSGRGVVTLQTSHSSKTRGSHAVSFLADGGSMDPCG